MERLTWHTQQGAAAAPDAARLNQGVLQGEAIEKLAACEDLVENLLERQQILSQRMEQLRKTGKEHSALFRQLFAEKLQNTAFLAALAARGLAPLEGAKQRENIAAKTVLNGDDS